MRIKYTTSGTPHEPSDVSPSEASDQHETQIGGGPSLYRLRSNISLTHKAPAESHVAAGRRRIHYPGDATADTIGDSTADIIGDSTADTIGDELDVDTLKSMCVGEPFKLTPSPPHTQHHPISTPAIEHDVFFAPSSQNVLPVLPQPTLSTSEAVKERVFGLLGFEAPRYLPGLPPPPSPASPVKACHKKDDPNPQDANYDEVDDYDTFTPSCGRLSNSDHNLLEGTFKQCLEILSSTATEVKRDPRSVIKHFV